MRRWVCVLFCFSLSWGQPLRPSEESLRARQRFLQAVQEEHFATVENDARAARLTTIGQRLAQKARRPIPWSFVLVRSEEPNAACSGEGMVFVTTGLMDLGLDDDELAGVLAHEVIHGVRQHVEADFLELARLDKAIEEYRQHQQRHGNDRGELAQMRENYEANRLQQQLDRTRSYGRQRTAFNLAQEREADGLGLKLAVEAGFRADGLMRALQKLMAHDCQKYGQSSVLGSKTHPPLPQRIQRLGEIQGQLGY